MDKVIRLHGSPHEQTQRLLPWYNNGTLDAAEEALVEEHLSECAECRADADADRLLAKQVSSLPMDVEHGWAMLSDRVEQRTADVERQVAGTAEIVRLPFWRRRVPVAWMVTGQVAAMLLVFAAFAVHPTQPSDGAYHALGAAPVRASGNVVIVFEPQTNEQRMRDALRSVDAHVVDGPNTSGAYILQVPSNARADAVRELRAMREVVLAEPIGSGGAS